VQLLRTHNHGFVCYEGQDNEPTDVCELHINGGGARGARGGMAHLLVHAEGPLRIRVLHGEEFRDGLVLLQHGRQRVAGDKLNHAVIRARGDHVVRRQAQVQALSAPPTPCSPLK
jgi:hypothetical protein